MFLVLFALTSFLATRTTISANPVCFPNEVVEDCLKRHKESDNAKQVNDESDKFGNEDINEIDNEIPCLGVDLNNGGEGKPYFL